MARDSTEYKAFDSWVKRSGYGKVDAELVFFKVSEFLLTELEARIANKGRFDATDEWDIGYKSAIDSVLKLIRDIKERGAV